VCSTWAVLATADPSPKFQEILEIEF